MLLQVKTVKFTMAGTASLIFIDLLAARRETRVKTFAGSVWDRANIRISNETEPKPTTSESSMSAACFFRVHQCTRRV